jgi:phosphatidylserine/phosphatidylglycerophosphate/cardiolipin synthase-like enzyme
MPFVAWAGSIVTEVPRLAARLHSGYTVGMKPLVLSFVVAVGLGLPPCGYAPAQDARPEVTQPATIAVYFNPGGGATAAIVKEIQAARQSILVQAYGFTSAPIAKALVEAHRRGVRVSVILDKGKASEESDSQAGALLRQGVPTRLDGTHRAAHNKVMILDGQIVITGSFNFTKHSERDNAENLLVIRDRALAERYAANWKLHAEHSVVMPAPK